MKFNSLRMRFALWTAILILIVLSGFGLFVYLNMANGLYDALDNALAVNASQIMASLNIDNGVLTLPDSLTESPGGEALPEGYSVRILSPDGKVLEQSGTYTHQMPGITSPVVSPLYTTLKSESLRIYTVPVTDNNQFIAVVQVTQSTRDIQDTLQRLLLTLLIASPVLLLVAAVSGYLLAAKALQPIDTMTRMARHISAEDLSLRLNLSGDDELGRLASTFDDMLERLQDSFRREKQFTADASHELRTPLAAMQAILSVTRQRRRSPEEYEQALDDLTEETDRLRQLTETLLALARTDLHPTQLYETIDLSQLLGDIAESMRPLAESRGLQLVLQNLDPCEIQGDRDGIIRVLINLVDNAIKYTEHGQVSLSCGQNDHWVWVEIKDTGIGIAEEHLPHIFERFYRIEQSRSQPGTGLGLALTKQIVEMHGGRITVSSTPGAGTLFILHFPCIEK